MQHSFQELKDIKIKEKDLIEEANAVREKTSLLLT